MRVAVVGAGLAGLSAACHLRGRGHDVRLLERSSVPGGLVAAMERGGYRLATGATVMTMPALLEQTFAAAGASMDDHLRLVPLDPAYRATFPDGSEIHVRAGREAMVEEIAKTCGRREADGFVRFADWVTELYDVEIDHFIGRNFDSPLDLLRPLAPLLHLVRLGGLRRLHGKVASYFADDRLQRLFTFQSLYAGLSPFEALAIYAVITYMDTVAGVHAVDGGVAAVGPALAAAATGAGVDVVLDAEVVAVERGPGGGVRGVRTGDGRAHAADAVVLAGDLPAMHRTLLPDIRQSRVLRRGERSPSCLVWSAGVRGALPPATEHHNIHFGGDWREAFGAVLKSGTRMPDPSLLVTVESATDPSLAPPGANTLFALEPVPNLDGRVDWSVEGDEARARLVERLRAMGYPTAQVDVELWRGPVEWAALGLDRGTPFALSHRFSQTGPFRTANVDRRAPGVVLAGAWTVPGVGMPMALLSGRLAAERVEQLA